MSPCSPAGGRPARAWVSGVTLRLRVHLVPRLLATPCCRRSRDNSSPAGRRRSLHRRPPSRCPHRPSTGRTITCQSSCVYAPVRLAVRAQLDRERVVRAGRTGVEDQATVEPEFIRPLAAFTAAHHVE